MTEDEAWQELERKQLNKKQKENEMKNKDLLFSHWYDSLEGTKSQGFAYKAWCAGWSAAQKESNLQEISDIGQDIEWDTSDMAHRTGGLSVEQEKLCKYCGGIGRVVCDGRCMPEQEPESWMGVSDNPYCNDVDGNDPNGRAMRWHNKLLELRKQVALDGLAETSREIEQEPVAWVRDLTSPQPHCVTSMKYLSIADTDAGVKYIPVYTALPKPQNELDAIDRAYFAGKEAGIAVGEAETKHFEDLAEYRLKLLLKMPEQKEWVGLTDEDIDDVTGGVGFGYIDVSRAIEAKLRGKNT
jgi:hypothetical protein